MLRNSRTRIQHINRATTTTSHHIVPIVTRLQLGYSLSSNFRLSLSLSFGIGIGFVSGLIIVALLRYMRAN